MIFAPGCAGSLLGADLIAAKIEFITSKCHRLGLINNRCVELSPIQGHNGGYRRCKHAEKAGYSTVQQQVPQLLAESAEDIRSQ